MSDAPTLVYAMVEDSGARPSGLDPIEPLIELAVAQVRRALSDASLLEWRN